MIAGIIISIIVFIFLLWLIAVKFVTTEDDKFQLNKKPQKIKVDEYNETQEIDCEDSESEGCISCSLVDSCTTGNDTIKEN